MEVTKGASPSQTPLNRKAMSPKKKPQQPFEGFESYFNNLAQQEETEPKHGLLEEGWSKSMSDYFFRLKSFMDDFDDVISENRRNLLNKYCVWKIKKWQNMTKK
jgi:hypothetical protein